MGRAMNQKFRSRMLLTASTLAIGIYPAFANDVKPAAAPAPTPPKMTDAMPAASWTGFYVGLGVGGSYAFSDLAMQDSAIKKGSVTDIYDLGAQAGRDSFLATLEAGYDYRVNDSFILGVIANYDFSSGSAGVGSDDVKIDPKKGDSVGDVYGASFNVGNSWAIGARAGVLVNPQTMFYGVGGFTQAEVGVNASYQAKQGATGNDDWSAGASEWASGFFVGAGIETALSRNLAAKLEYRFSRFDGFGASGMTIPSKTGSYREGMVSTGDINLHSIRFAFDYYFDGNLPQAAVAVASGPRNWTGAYLGAGLGGSYGFSDLAIQDSAIKKGSVTEIGEFGAQAGRDSFLATVEAGYDYQVNNSFILGVLGNYDFTSGSAGLASDSVKIDAKKGDSVNDVYGAGFDVGSSWAIGARAGVLLNPRTLFYGAGGFTQADIGVNASYQATQGVTGDNDWSASSKEWASGFFVGAGLESMLTEHVAAKLEYRFSRFDGISGSGMSIPSKTGSYHEGVVSTGDVNVHAIRASLVWRF